MIALSTEARNIIQDYLLLPFPGQTVNTPYFNNQRTKTRAALRVLVGKGTPQEIVEEAHIISLRERLDINNAGNEDLKKFLVDQNLGIDCSALTYYILDAECRAKKLGPLKKLLKFSAVKNPFRNLLIKLRPVENTNVETLAHDNNSVLVAMSDVQPGDMLLLWRTREDHALNHLLLICDVDQTTITYVHSFRWSKEGKYDHGVRQGTIEIIDPQKSWIEQLWTEKNKTGEENETLRHARLAEKVELRRLRCLEE